MNIRLEIKPLTYNQYYRNTKSGHRIKTGAGLAYDEELGELLKDYAAALSNFGKEIDLSKNIVRLQIQHYNPKFYVKDNSRLSKTAGDTDGIIKILQDKIFNAMGLDDYIVKSLIVDQYPGRDHVVCINIDTLLLSSIQYSPIGKD